MSNNQQLPEIFSLLGQNTSNKIAIKETQTVFKHYDVFIDSEVTDQEEYRELILLLFNAAPEDTIRLYINSGGGSLDTAFAIIEGLKNTDATVNCVLLGQCHSAASIIAFNCHEITVLESSYIMIHIGSLGSVGTTNNVKSHVDFITKQVISLLHSSYDGFLTPLELESVKHGAELWFNAEEIKTRLALKSAHMQTLLGETETGSVNDE